ncbi:hypothetical protein [Amycolatopsis vancoresmycina]|uniref:hypothetical protein n=1 Tax=Amycolatopsis vancoresmycina TaxID=208444 RepID=UPI0012DC18CD|nr:hypothetical protein [Amycolatopsis vancoresmycina]
MSLLTMQRTAGNRAIGALLSGRVQAHPVAVQRRRVPTGAQTGPLTSVGATDRAQHTAGLERVNERALTELAPADRAAVLTRAHTLAGSPAAYNALPAPDRARLLAEAIRAQAPGLVLGDPALINIGVRPGALGVADAANIAALVTNATALINTVIGGAHDGDLRQVFGPPNVATAKARYRAARDRMNYLHTHHRIVTDRSGYSAEAGVGGLTDANRISLMPGAIDHPANDENVVLIIHEAMHAGNFGVVDDRGYPASPSFVSLRAVDKLGNAAHYEVVPRRVRGLPNSFLHTVFVPAGSSVTLGGHTHTAPPLTTTEQAARQASEAARAAWNMGLNLHTLWVRLHLHPADWTGAALAGEFGPGTAATFSACMPYWSLVQGLTVHTRPGLSAAAATPSAAPVTAVDVALSEGLVRLLSLATQTVDTQFASAAATNAFLLAQTTAPERAAASTIPLLKELLLIAVRRSVGELTGTPFRDVRVITTMAAAAPTYALMLAPRAPAGFP